jgi:hypothetical protein
MAMDLLNTVLPDRWQTGPHRTQQLGDDELAKWRAVRANLRV